jgi:3-dehydroquinate dehydratase-2
MRILVLHGINLDASGKPDPAQFGTVTVEAVDERLHALATELGVEVEVFQATNEYRLCGRIGAARGENVDAVVINPGAWTYTGQALRDALAELAVPVIEVHVPNIHAQHPFGAASVVAPVVRGRIAGFGAESYLMGLRAAMAVAGRR